jgi:ABC-type dipeptide/oligopeptide/nickel transport system ATPase component
VPQATVSGSIRYAGQDLLGLPADQMRALRGARISMIFQEPMTALNPVMRIADQIAEAVIAHRRATRQAALRVAIEAMREVAIPESERRAREYPHQLSGGMRQRVMIAMAVVNRPQLLIADEPTTALDVTIQAQILELLRELRRKHSLAMLFISHDLGVISQIVDRIAVMYGGRIQEMGSVKQVFTNPQHPYTRGLLDAVPSLRSDRMRPLRTIVPAQPWMTGAARPLVEVEAGHWARTTT